MRALTAAAVLFTMGAGVAIPLLFGQDADPRGRELTRAEVEGHLGEDLVIPAGRAPDSVTCRRVSEDAFLCTARYRGRNEGEAEFSGYEVIVPDHEPSPAERQLQEFLLQQSGGP